ncbi:hypothetical protein PISMIDRAFT_687813 [Pisolithus microcarpus 441]|uniref:Uncharacterized protein n=1 Tax=Pisolithus microcarpus 441 TaxID=765257 RepID=A0A0C9YWS0_9AGAM|nr:hypothetical protein PISMIDRAFT_687813 [Pisolithus microcarpus 441]
MCRLPNDHDVLFDFRCAIQFYGLYRGGVDACGRKVVQWVFNTQLLAASRQTFAFARDSVLPLSSILYRINSFTGTPINVVWIVILMAALSGLLAFSFHRSRTQHRRRWNRWLVLEPGLA